MCLYTLVRLCLQYVAIFLRVVVSAGSLLGGRKQRYLMRNLIFFDAPNCMHKSTKGFVLMGAADDLFRFFLQKGHLLGEA